MSPQTTITADTRMGGTLVSDGATFRFWAPRAKEVYLCGKFAGRAFWAPTTDRLMQRGPQGHWIRFEPNAKLGDEYKFYVVGTGSRGYKRDPYARELTKTPAFPGCNCVLRPEKAFPWGGAAFVPPDYADMILYQLHVGTYSGAMGTTGTFLDVLRRIKYLAALGINMLQLLPVDEAESHPTMGYNGADYFAPDSTYVVDDPAALKAHLAVINCLRQDKGVAPITAQDLTPASHQLQALVDCCHLYGIGVVFDVVYNHAGGFEGDDESLYFEDRAPPGNNNDSLYFTDRGWAGGLSFALWNRDVRQFLINSAKFYVEEFHVDGLRYDEISALLAMNGEHGLGFCRDITSTLRGMRSKLLQNAEYWPAAAGAAIVSRPEAGGVGFDVLQHDALRRAIRDAIAKASGGASAGPIDLQAIADALRPPGLAEAWRAVTCVENHDLVKVGAEARIPYLADGSNARSWFARSRSRVATALLLTAPGIPQLFMGQELLEDKQWSDNPKSPNRIYWKGLASDPAMQNQLRFTRELIALRRSSPALRGEKVRAFHVHDANRVLAFHRWIEGAVKDIIVVASLNETTYYDYWLGFPHRGAWLEVFNSDVYDGWVNPIVAGNGGRIEASGEPMHGFPSSASVVIPANGVVIFARE